MIISLVGQKGGSGKTTTAIAIAAEWFARGRRVLLVDADPQASARTWADVASELGHPAPTTVSMGSNLHRPDQLPTLAANYDLTLIDCPPRHGATQRAALVISQFALIPCGPSAVDAWALAETIDLVLEAQVLQPTLKPAIIITRKMARTVLGGGARDALASCGLPILKTELGYRVAYQEAPATGLGVTQYAPTSVAAKEIRSLVDEIETFAHTQEAAYVAA